MSRNVKVLKGQVLVDEGIEDMKAIGDNYKKYESDGK